MINSKYLLKNRKNALIDSSHDEIRRFVYVQNVVESCTSRLVLISVAVGAAGTRKMDPA